MSLVLTNEDHTRLQEMMFFAECPRSTPEAMAFERLLRTLSCANVVPPERIPPDVVTMNSMVLVRDLDSSERLRVVLCWPEDEDPSHDCVSVLMPLGTTLIGKHEGDVVDWIMPTGRRRIRIESVLYQPEAGPEGRYRPATARYVPMPEFP